MPKQRLNRRPKPTSRQVPLEPSDVRLQKTAVPSGLAQPPVRLQKLLAEAGVASRRAAERLIRDGHVTVNEVVVRELGSAAVPGRDRIAVDGAPLQPPAAHTYLVLHKPPGFVTSLRDPHAERTVIDLLPPNAPRLYPVGRLDRESEGLLLLTDDGALTERLLHPRYGVEREYAALVKGDLTAGALAKLREGITVEGVLVVPRAVIVTLPPPALTVTSPPGTRWLRITLAEGRKREVRVMCAAVHLYVLRLIRVRFGPLTLGDLPPGHSRPLTEQERSALLSPDVQRIGPPRRLGNPRANAGTANWARRGPPANAGQTANDVQPRSEGDRSTSRRGNGAPQAGYPDASAAVRRSRVAAAGASAAGADSRARTETPAATARPEPRAERPAGPPAALVSAAPRARNGTIRPLPLAPTAAAPSGKPAADEALIQAKGAAPSSGTSLPKWPRSDDAERSDVAVIDDNPRSPAEASGEESGADASAPPRASSARRSTMLSTVGGSDAGAASSPDAGRRATLRRSKRRAAGRAQRASSKGKRSSEEASSN